MDFSLPEERWERSLPKEMWSIIWSDLTFETKKTCVLVCQGWFKNIRGDGRLSGQLSLKNAEMEEEEAKEILAKWTELRILRLSKNLYQVDLSKTHKFLKKVIVPNVPEGYKNLLVDFPAEVNQWCFNPQDKSRSIGLENITELTLHDTKGLQSEKPFEPMQMINLNRLNIILNSIGIDSRTFESIFEPLFQGIGLSSDLDEVRLDCCFYTKCVQICGDLISRHLSKITRLEIVGPVFFFEFENLRRFPQLKSVKNLIFSKVEIESSDQIVGYDVSIDPENLLWIPELESLKTLMLANITIHSGDIRQMQHLETCFETLETYVKRLELCGSVFYENSMKSTYFTRLSEIFPALTTLTITDSNLEFSTSRNQNLIGLEKVLNALGTTKTKNLKISGMHCELEIPEGSQRSRDGRRMVKNAMQEALEIIEKKFPLDSTEIEIEAKSTDGLITIIKEKGKGPFLNVN